MTEMTKRDKALLLGKQAALSGKTLADNPYKTRRMLGLSQWWIKAFNEANNDSSK